MIKALIRNHAHGSRIAIFYVYNKGSRPVAVEKIGIDTDSYNVLQNELAGWTWQLARFNPLHLPAPEILAENGKDYLKLKLPYVDGQSGGLGEPLEKVKKNLAVLVDHYIKIWPQNNQPPLHGDYSLDNHLFSKSGITVIDWEHFHPQSPLPWGFDATNALLEALYFDMLQRKQEKPAESQILCLIDPLAKLVDAGMSPELAAEPLGHLRRLINENAALWGEQLQNFPQKLPVLSFSELQVSIIDDMITRKLRAVMYKRKVSNENYGEV